MIGQDYFSSKNLETLDEQSGGLGDLTIHLHGGEKVDAMIIVQAEPGYVVVEVGPYYKVAGTEERRNRNMAIAYESIERVEISSEDPKDKTKLGFHRS